MEIVLRIVQIAALAAGVGLFALFAYSDPAFPPSRWFLLIGCGTSGFGLMWFMTFVIVALVHGIDAAKSMEWY